jgi:hypothetical protein
MQAVEQLIGDLLLKHNCVIVPAFGGFVASQTSAYIDYSKGTMLPPKKSLLFNRQLVNNDGLLITEYAAQSAISFDHAQQAIADLANRWNDSLKRGERVHLDRVGHLYLDAERNICFEQDRFFNLLMESYGLGKVQFIPEVEEKTQINSTEPNVIAVDFGRFEDKQAPIETPVIPHPEMVQHRKVWRYIAAACLLPIAFYSFWIPMKTDVLESGMLSIKDFNPFYSSSEGVYVPVEKELKGLADEDEPIEETVARIPHDVEVFSYRFDDDLYIPVRIKSKSSENKETTAPAAANTTINKPQQGLFKVIVGCFGDHTNAANLVKKLRDEGFDATLAGEAGGLTRVSAGSADSQQDLQALSARIAEKGYTGWVLK